MKKTLIAILLLALPVLAQAQSTLYAVSLDGYYSSDPGPSNLYTVDPVTGAGTLVGNMGYAVNAIAVDPTTGKMYASTTAWSGDFNGLLLIDRATGAATEIGPFASPGGDPFWAILGLTFDSSGQLWGWHDPNEDDAVKIDKNSGEVTRAGESGIGTSAHVLAFDASDVLHVVQYESHYTIDQGTGAAVFVGNLSFDPGSGGATFDFNTGELLASRYNGQTQDSYIRFSDLGGDSYTDLDTDVEYLNALTYGVDEMTYDSPQFRVSKRFLDGSDEEVEVTLSCNGGLPLEQTVTMSDGDVVTFTLTNVPDGGVNCTVTESNGPENYEAVMNGGSGCSWEDATDGLYLCSIVNTPLPADFTVVVDWEISDTADLGVGEGTYVFLYCMDALGYSSTSYDASPSVEGPFMLEELIPPADCYAGMGGYGSEIDVDYEDCEDVEIGVGDEDNSCTIIATAFFEGVPTLSQWGKAVMVLLVLGMGLVGMRRFF